MILKIITHPNSNLRLKSHLLEKEDILTKETQKFIKDLGQTMIAKDGLGLAAPQVGEQLRIFVVNTRQGVKEFINPEIIKKSWRKVKGEEGCLSIPQIYGKIKRHKKILVRYLDKQAQEHILKVENLLARVIQHENDHLEGILFVDYIKDKKDLIKIDVREFVNRKS